MLWHRGGVHSKMPIYSRYLEISDLKLNRQNTKLSCTAGTPIHKGHDWNRYQVIAVTSERPTCIIRNPKLLINNFWRVILKSREKERIIQRLSYHITSFMADGTKYALARVTKSKHATSPSSVLDALGQSKWQIYKRWTEVKARWTLQLKF